MKEILTRRLKPMVLISFLAAFAILGFTVSAIQNDDAYADEKKLPAPSLKVKAAKSGSVKISWTKVNGAYGYKLYYSKKKRSGYRVLAYSYDGSTSYLHEKAAMGTRYYYKVAADDGFKDGRMSVRKSVKTKSYYKNSKFKFTIPKYWRGKVYVTLDPYNNKTSQWVSIRDLKSGAPLAGVGWSRTWDGNDGDIVSHVVERKKRGKGMVEVSIASWGIPLSVYKYYGGAFPYYNTDDYEGKHTFSKSEVNHVIKLQTGGKYTYKKVWKIKKSKMSSYNKHSDKYLKNKLKVKVIR